MAGNVLDKLHSGGPNYPFVDDATFATNENSDQLMPASMFVDAIIYPPDGTSKQYLSRLSINKGILTVGIGDLFRELCSGTLDLSSGSREVLLTDAYGRVCGMLLGNPNIAEFAGGIPEGSYTFNAEATEFVPSAVVPQPQVCVRGFLVNDTDLLAGDVWLVGKGGVALSADVDQNAVVVNLVGDPLFKRRKCITAQADAEGSTVYVAPTPLREIKIIQEDNANAVLRLLPDEYGNVFITPGSNQAADNVLRIEQLQNGIRFRALGNVVNLGP